MEETPLFGGWVNQAMRVGNTVRRNTGPWTPAVHALLKHLEAAGFQESPRVLGFDDKGREVLRYIEGTAALRPWPAELLQDRGLAALARMLRRYHDAVATFVPAAGAVWRAGVVPLRAGEVIRHGDFGPWNTIWREGRPVGLIDWDFAEPGPTVLDVGQLAWFGIPLSTLEGVREAGFGSPPDLRHRLDVICEGYADFRPREVLDAVAEVQRIDLQRLREWGTVGIEPWAGFLPLGEVERIEADMAWLRENRTLVGSWVSDEIC